MVGYLCCSAGDLVLEVSVGAVPRNRKKAKKARNAKKASGKLLREEGLGRRVPSGSAESEAGPYNQEIRRRQSCGKYFVKNN